MKTSHSLQCGLLAASVVRVPVEVIPELRKKPGPVPAGTLSPAFLKHSDEQTVVGLSAVYQAMESGDLLGKDFSQWGVLGAPRWLGRNTVGAILSRFDVEGAWGVSPHLIPHRSLHSLSGTISLALKSQGANYGVGGSQGLIGETFLSALALLKRYDLPGVWAVFTQLDPEFPPIPSGQPVPGSTAVAAAMALTPWNANSDLPCVRVHTSMAQSRDNSVPLDSLIVALDRLKNGSPRQVLELEHGAWLEVTSPARKADIINKTIRPPVRWTIGSSVENKQ